MTAAKLGRTLIVEDCYGFRGAGVLEELPSNSHFDFDIIAPMASVRDIQNWALRSWYYHVHVRLYSFC